MNLHAETKYLEELASDSHKAFEMLFVKYFPKVKYFIAHLIKSEEIAEELSQDIFIRIWINRKNLSHIQSFNSYIYRMAKNAAINHMEHLYVEETYLKNYEEHKSPTIEEELYAKETELLIQLVVNNMPPQRKRIYEMSRMEGLKNEEIAEQLNLSKKTVENHLNLALKEIRKTISLLTLFFV